MSAQEVFLRKYFPYFISVVLTLILVFNIIRLEEILMRYFQIDFSAYYSASLAKVEGQNPYSFTYQINGMRFEHSEFLQPPIISDLFIPLTFLTYRNAKLTWFLAQIILFFLGIFLVTRRLNISLLLITIFLSGMPFLFWPFFVHLERGQTDVLVLFFICLSYFFYKKNLPLQAGIFLSIAGFLKLPAFLLFLIPIFIKEKKFLYSGILSSFLILILSMVMDGVVINRDYFLSYLPSILKTTFLPVEVFNSSIENQQLNADRFAWDGYTYITALPLRAANGSLSRFISDSAGRVYGSFTYSIGFLVSLLMGLFFSRKTINQPDNYPKHTLDILWPFMMTSILVFHPMTWVMNYVWIYIILILIIPFWKLTNMKIPILAVIIFSLFISLNDSVFGLARRTIMRLTHNQFPIDLSFIINNRIWMCGLAIWLIFLIIFIFSEKLLALDKVDPLKNT